MALSWLVKILLFATAVVGNELGTPNLVVNEERLDTTNWTVRRIQDYYLKNSNIVLIRIIF